MTLKERAIQLRREGATYSEILREVRVARSTLSLWLRSVQLSKQQQHRITQKKLECALRGAQKRRNERILLSQKIRNSAKSEIGLISERELWLMGIMLYWAEGAKDRYEKYSQGIVFSNSDPRMVRLFLEWLVKILKIPENQIVFEIYIHEIYRDNIIMFREFWAAHTGYPTHKFGKIYYKRNKLNSNRQNKGEKYKGLLRVKVTRSTNLNRKISGWIEFFNNYCGVVQR